VALALLERLRRCRKIDATKPVSPTNAISIWKLERLSLMLSWIYPWREPGRRYLRSVQPDNATVERKKVINNALTMAGVLAARVSLCFVSAISGSAIKVSNEEP
jgi:hypothetical protein